MTADDPLSKDVSIEARITKTGLTARGRTRAVEYLVSFRAGPEAEPDSVEIDPDWLNHFGGYAAKATSEPRNARFPAASAQD